MTAGKQIYKQIDSNLERLFDLLVSFEDRKMARIAFYSFGKNQNILSVFEFSNSAPFKYGFNLL